MTEVLEDKSTQLPASPLVVFDRGALVKYSIADAVIDKMRDEYSPLNCDTPEGYEATRIAIGKLVKCRTATDAERLKMGADARDFIKAANNEGNRLIGRIEEIEKPLRERKDAVDLAKQREAEAKAAAVKAEQERVENERLAAIEAERQAKIAAENERLKAEQLRLAEERRKLNEERERVQAEMAAAKAEQDRLAQIERDKLEAERQKQIEAERAERKRLDEERAAQKAIEDRERAKLEAQRLQLEQEKWVVQKEKDRQERVEFERQAKIKAEAQAKADSEQAEKNRIERERLQQLENERRKAEEEARQKAVAEAEAAEAKRLEAMRPDVDRIHAFGDYLDQIEWPNVSDRKAKVFMGSISRRIKKIAKECKDATIEVVEDSDRFKTP